MPPPNDPAQNRSDVFAVFCGSIDQQSVQRIFSSLTAATQPSINVGRFHLIFQSSGGNVGDGVCLYNFFKTLPVELVLYNVGATMSAAAIAYLGANKRCTSARASFMVHRTHVSPQSAKAQTLKACTDMVALDDSRTESILRAHLNLPDWGELDRYDLFFSGEEAVKVGLADEICEFSPPPGTQIFNV
jgi:ATP-dependent protease ClpP protease subunit